MTFQSPHIPGLARIFLFRTEFETETIQLPLIAFYISATKKRNAILTVFHFQAGIRQVRQRLWNDRSAG